MDIQDDEGQFAGSNRATTALFASAQQVIYRRFFYIINKKYKQIIFY